MHDVTREVGREVIAYSRVAVGPAAERSGVSRHHFVKACRVARRKARATERAGHYDCLLVRRHPRIHLLFVERPDRTLAVGEAVIVLTCSLTSYPY